MYVFLKSGYVKLKKKNYYVKLCRNSFHKLM